MVSYERITISNLVFVKDMHFRFKSARPFLPCLLINIIICAFTGDASQGDCKTKPLFLAKKSSFWDIALFKTTVWSKLQTLLIIHLKFIIIYTFFVKRLPNPSLVCLSLGGSECGACASCGACGCAAPVGVCGADSDAGAATDMSTRRTTRLLEWGRIAPSSNSLPVLWRKWEKWW